MFRYGHHTNLSSVALLIIVVFFLPQAIRSQEVRDVDGNAYTVVAAGEYLWMGENLRVRHDPGGNELTCFEVENPYMDDAPYGLLYSWQTAMDSCEYESAQGICPDGWHIPSDAEWDSLTAWAGGVNKAGVVLMQPGVDGLGVKLAGNYNPIQKMHSYFGEEAYFWTSTSYNHHAAWMRNVGKPKKNINRSTVSKHYGFSIRCVRKVEKDLSDGSRQTSTGW